VIFAAGIVFGERLREEQRAAQESLEQSRNAVRAFRFLCPSYYVPGDKSWGAF